MGLKPEKRILVVEDESNWQQLIGELLHEVAGKLSCTIQIVSASSFAEALTYISTISFDCVTVDNKLQDGTVAKPLLDRIARLDQGVPVVVISGVVDPSDVGDFFTDYRIERFFWKNDFSPSQFKQTIVKLLVNVEPVATDEEHQETGDRHMDWNTIISLAVSAVSPYAVAVATSAATTAGKELGETASESTQGLWQWIRQIISKSNDKSAEKVWEGFKKDPQSNKDALVDVIRRLSPDDDAVLRGYVQGLIQELEHRKKAQLYSLLDKPGHYTFNDLKRICSRVSTQWEDETGSNPTREALARWIVGYAPTRNKLQDLIGAMLEVNPTVMLQ